MYKLCATACQILYIYRKKMNKENISLVNYLRQLRWRLKIEYTLCEKENKTTMFNSKWSAVVKALEDMN